MVLPSILDKYDQKKDRDMISFLLQSRPPNPLETSWSGLDCLVTVLRVIYANTMLDEPISESITGGTEGFNPICQYAWRLFGDTETTNEAEESEKQRVLKKTLRSGEGQTFDDLVNCRSMKVTFWDRPSFHLFRPRLKWQATESKWIEVPWDRGQAGERSLIDLDYIDHPGQTIEQVLHAAQGEVFGERGRVLRRFQRPKLI